MNPQQYQTDSPDGWHKKGDWVDVVLGTAPPNNPVTRAKIDQFTGPIVLHCHITAHEDAG